MHETRSKPLKDVRSHAEMGPVWIFDDRTGPIGLKFVLVQILPLDSHHSCSRLLSKNLHAFSARFY